MNLNDYILNSAKPAAILAGEISVSPVLISQWRSGTRPVPIERCVAIERATNGQVTRRDLRPHDWASIWPELVDKAN